MNPTKGTACHRHGGRALSIAPMFVRIEICLFTWVSAYPPQPVIDGLRSREYRTRLMFSDVFYCYRTVMYVVKCFTGSIVTQ